MSLLSPGYAQICSPWSTRLPAPGNRLRPACLRLEPLARQPAAPVNLTNRVHRASFSTSRGVQQRFLVPLGNLPRQRNHQLDATLVKTSNAFIRFKETELVLQLADETSNQLGSVFMRLSRSEWTLPRSTSICKSFSHWQSDRSDGMQLLSVDQNVRLMVGH